MIGIAWWREGALTVNKAHALRLFTVTNRIVASRPGIVAQVRHIIGLWTYALLLRRPAFEIIFQTFRFLEYTSVPMDTGQRIPESVIGELEKLLDVLPLLAADLRQKLPPRSTFLTPVKRVVVSSTPIFLPERSACSRKTWPRHGPGRAGTRRLSPHWHKTKAT